MSRIYFNSDRAYHQLTKAGVVVTLRKAGTKYARGSLIQVWRHGKDTGIRVRVGNVGYIDTDRMLARHSIAILESYVHLSGFNSVSDWALRAQELSGKRHQWGLWEVTVDHGTY